MKPYLSRLLQAPPWRAVIESAWLTAVLITAFGSALDASSKYASGNGLLLSVGLGGFWACLRARSLKGRLVKVAMLEGLLALGVTAGLYAAFELSILITRQSELITGSLGASAWLIPLFAGLVGFLGLRALRYLYQLWDRQRKRHYYWELANAMTLVVVLLMVLLWSVLFLFAGSSPLIHASPASTNPFEAALEGLLTRLFPGTMILVLFVLAALALLLPLFAVFSYWVARRLTWRLDSLGKAAGKMRAGDLSARVPVDGQDELSQLQLAFNEMAENLQTATTDLQAQARQTGGAAGVSAPANRQRLARAAHASGDPTRVPGIEPGPGQHALP